MPVTIPPIYCNNTVAIHSFTTKERLRTIETQLNNNKDFKKRTETR